MLMMAYIGLLFQKIKSNKIVFYSILIILAFFCGFRGDEIGIDTPYYHEAFNDITSGSQYFIKEPIYVFFVKLIHQIGASQQLVFLVVAILTIFFYGKFILKYSPIPFLSLFIFITMGVFYLSTYNQARQYLAISIFACFALKYVVEKSFWKYTLSVILIGLCAHLSALFLIPFYFLLNKKISVYKKTIIALMVVFMGSFFVYLISISPYAYFVMRWEEIEGRSTFLLLTQLAISVFIMFFEKKICSKDENMLLFVNMNFISFLLVLAMFVIPSIPHELLGRINNYFYVCTLILLPYILGLFSKNNRIILHLVLILFLTAYFFRNTYIQGAESMLYPYEFSFDLLKK